MGTLVVTMGMDMGMEAGIEVEVGRHASAAPGGEREGGGWERTSGMLRTNGMSFYSYPLTTCSHLLTGPLAFSTSLSTSFLVLGAEECYGFDYASSVMFERI